MKTKPILILILFPLVCLTCTTDKDGLQLPNYPKYREVIIKFLDSYSISEIEFPNQFSLAKKPDGWHAMITDIVEEKVIQDDIFWVRKLKIYTKTNFPLATRSASSREHQSMIEDWNNNYFSNILPFWNYTGWDKDIINTYGNKSNLSDTLLNALARAYTSTARSFLIRTPLAAKNVRFDLPNGQNALTESQLAKYREIQHKGIDTYYKLWKLNPDFETFVANIYNVYSNEVMANYLTILYHQNYDEAQKELKEGLYDSFLLDWARRYLASCDTNAILFTNGDNDTFPLLYVQENEGFRKDVTVVNIALLNLGRYISYLLQEHPDREPIHVSLPDNIYRNDSIPYLYVRDQITSVPFNRVIEFVASTDPRTKLQLPSGEEYHYIPTKKISIAFNIDNLPDGYQKAKNELSKKDSLLIVELKEGFFYLNHFCMIDILGTNNFTRPVYFAMTVSQDNYINLEDHFQCEGLAYKITPLKIESSKDLHRLGYIDTDIQYKKLMEDAAFQTSDDSLKYYDEHKRMTRFYRRAYGRLAEKLIDENKKDKALNVLNYCEDEFSSDKTEYGYMSINLIEGYYRLNQTDKANEMVEELYQSVISIFEDEVDSPTLWEYETRLKAQILQDLRNLTSQYIEGSPLNLDIISSFDLIMEKYR